MGFFSPDFWPGIFCRHLYLFSCAGFFVHPFSLWMACHWRLCRTAKLSFLFHCQYNLVTLGDNISWGNLLR